MQTHNNGTNVVIYAKPVIGIYSMGNGMELIDVDQKDNFGQTEFSIHGREEIERALDNYRQALSMTGRVAEIQTDPVQFVEFLGGSPFVNLHLANRPK